MPFELRRYSWSNSRKIPLSTLWPSSDRFFRCTSATPISSSSPSSATWRDRRLRLHLVSNELTSSSLPIVKLIYRMFSSSNFFFLLWAVHSVIHIRLQPVPRHECRPHRERNGKICVNKLVNMKTKSTRSWCPSRNYVRTSLLTISQAIRIMTRHRVRRRRHPLLLKPCP